MITAFTDSLAEEFLQPLIVVRLELQDTATFLIGLATSSGDLGVLLAAPFVPGLLQVLAPVTFVRWSLLGLCLGIFLFPLFPNVYAWIALDFLFGVVTCGYLVLSDTLVNAASEDARRGRLIAIYMIAESLGAILGPLLLSRIGFAGLQPFAVASVIMFVGIVPWLLLRPDQAPSLQDEEPAPRFLHLMRRTPLILLLAVAAAFLADVPTSLFPVYALENGLDESTAVVMLSVVAGGTLAFQFPAGWGADALDRRVFLIGICVASIAGCLALPGVLTHTLWLAGVLFVLGGLFNAFDVLGLALIGQRVSLGSLAAMHAAVTLFSSVAGFLGPPATGLLMDEIGPEAFPVALAGMAGAVLLAALVDLWRRPRA